MNLLELKSKQLLLRWKRFGTARFMKTSWLSSTAKNNNCWGNKEVIIFILANNSIISDNLFLELLQKTRFSCQKCSPNVSALNQPLKSIHISLQKSSSQTTNKSTEHAQFSSNFISSSSFSGRQEPKRVTCGPTHSPTRRRFETGQIMVIKREGWEKTAQKDQKSCFTEYMEATTK